MAWGMCTAEWGEDAKCLRWLSPACRGWGWAWIVDDSVGLLGGLHVSRLLLPVLLDDPARLWGASCGLSAAAGRATLLNAGWTLGGPMQVFTIAAFQWQWLFYEILGIWSPALPRGNAIVQPLVCYRFIFPSY